jgi:hypothetical protein
MNIAQGYNACVLYVKSIVGWVSLFFEYYREFRGFLCLYVRIGSILDLKKKNSVEEKNSTRFLVFLNIYIIIRLSRYSILTYLAIVSFQN